MLPLRAQIQVGGHPDGEPSYLCVCGLDAVLIFLFYPELMVELDLLFILQSDLIGFLVALHFHHLLATMVGGEVSGDGFGNQCCRYCGVTAVDFGPKTVPVELGLLTGGKDDVVALFEKVAFHHYQCHLAWTEMAVDSLLNGQRQLPKGNRPFVVGPKRGWKNKQTQKVAQ